MVRFTKNSDIIDYLMTTDFGDINLSPSELVDILTLFKYQYRVAHGKVSAKEYTNSTLCDKITKLEKVVESLEKDKKLHEIKFDNLKNKQLSWKERFKGKIL